MSSPGSDRNLLFGVLALQMDFVQRDALITAMNAWALDKDKPLGRILVEQRALTEEEYALLDALVQKHLHKHGDDPQRSLAALSSLESARRHLEEVADADVQASLAHLSATSDGAPVEHTGSYAPPKREGASRFRILRPHAKGGLGEVFVAKDEELNREVALKEIQAKHAGQVESRSRFLVEAEVTGRLEHPGIVPVYSLGSYADGRPFYAMRFIRGDSLKEAIERFHDPHRPMTRGERALELRQLLGRFQDVCEAIAYAHSRGVLHRDLKPGNVMVGKFGETLVVDWGLAKLSGRDEPDMTEGPVTSTLSGDSALTQTGMVLGTPAYMSPEQSQGKLDRLGPASDVYSLGATLYCLLTGQPPFMGGASPEVLRKVQRGEFPPPRQLEPDVPRALEAVCLKAMALEPSRRYVSAKDLATDLERWLGDEPVAAFPEPWYTRLARWGRKRPALVAGVAALLFTGLLAFGIGGVLVSREKQRTLDEQGQRLAAQQERTVAQVDALLDANPRAVPAILANLEPFREQVRPRLRQERTKPEPAGATAAARKLWQQHRTRAALGLLANDPAQVPFLRQRLLAPEVEPEEALLIRDRLSAHKAELAEGLWQERGNFRALVALAAFDPDSPHWAEAAKEVVGPLLEAEPLHVGIWGRGLRPVRDALIPPLREIYRTGTESEKRLATDLLVDYAGDRPEMLAELLLEAEPGQFTVVYPRLADYREEAIGLLKAELTRSARDWHDPPLPPEWGEPGKNLVAEVEQAHGMVAGRFALCQTLPLQRLAAVAEGLRGSGYRPVRCRPFTHGEKVQVACLWQRDGRNWKGAQGLTREELAGQARELQKEGYLPADVAGYRVKADGQEEVRFAALWVKGNKGEQARLYAGVPAEEHKDGYGSFKTEGFAPTTVQGYRDGAGQVHYCGVWWKGEKTPARWNVSWDATMAQYLEKLDDLTRLPVDVDLVHYPEGAAAPKTAAQRIAEAEAEVKAKPGNLSAVYRRGQAYFHAGQDSKALADFDLVMKASKSAVNSYRYRAILHARRGHVEEARADLVQYQKRSTDADGKRYVAAVVSAWLGADAAGFGPLEQALARDPADPETLTVAARAYAAASAALATRGERLPACGALALWGGSARANPWGPLALATHLGQQARTLPARRQAYHKRALELLKQAAGAGYRDFTTLAADADLALLRDDPAFVALLRQSRPDLRYGVVSREDPTREMAHAEGLDVAAHLTCCRELAGQGYRPAGLAVAPSRDAAGEGLVLVGASLWHRPDPAGAVRDRLGRRQANASAALLRLKESEKVWPLLRHGPHPDARSHLIHRAARSQVDPAALIERLKGEQDVGIRKALILALGEYDGQALPERLRAEVKPLLLRWYREDPDPGIHGAIDWLLRHAQEGPLDRPLDWGGAEELARIDQELRGQPPGGRYWLVNGQGQALAIVDARKEFRMGSPVHEEGRGTREFPHRRRIGRVFAIGMKEVTVGQFQRFLETHPEVKHGYTRRYSPVSEGPQISVTWYEAAQYCRWLSEQEGVPEEQMCYPSVAQIEKCKDGVTPLPLPADYLSRRGYRLPSEAEWEYACRAGVQSAYGYGSGAGLLGEYAWCIGNAGDRTWPVGQKRPNAWGLFDTHGNVWEWCQEPYSLYKIGKGGIAAPDKEDNRDIINRFGRVLRGGSFIIHPRIARCANRSSNRPSIRINVVGLRVARTHH
jgi:formylglycine-generating enzyme required for sulfatase activity/tRNA A-37 threonylcarbamoyl transferase component Bud32